MLLAELLVKITGDNKQFKLMIGKSEAQLKRFRGFVNKHAASIKRLAFVMGTVLVAAAVVSIKKFSDYEKSLADINTIAKLTKDQLKGVSDEILALSVKVPQSAGELAAGLYDIYSAGFQGAKAMEILEVSAKAAVAGVSSTAVSAATLTGVLNAYGMEGDKATHISDILFKTVEKGVIRFEQMAAIMGPITAIASKAGVKFEEVGAALATMTKQGIKSNMAGVGLQQLMLSLIKPSEKMTALYKKLGWRSGEWAIKEFGLAKTLKKVTEATDGSITSLTELITEKRALIAASALTGTAAADFEKNLKLMENASGSTSKAFGEHTDKMHFAISEFKSSFSKAMIKIGEAASPTMIRTFKKMSETLNKLSEIDFTGFIQYLRDVETVLGAVGKKFGDIIKWLEKGRTQWKEAQGGALAFQKALERLYFGMKKSHGVSASWEEQEKKTGEQLDKTKKAIEGVGDALDDNKDKLKEGEVTAQEYGNVISGALNTTITSLLDSSATFTEKMTDILKAGLMTVLDIISLQIKAYIAANTVTTASTAGLTAPQLATSISQLAVLEGLKAAVGAIPLAEGGIVRKEGLYKMAEMNKPEAVIPLDKLQPMINQASNYNNTNNKSNYNIVINTQEVDSRKIDLELQKLEKRRGQR